MRTTDYSSTPVRGGRRFLSGVALCAFLGAFFVIPLWAAMTLCTMPCCHPQLPSTPSVVTGTATCMPECSIASADDATESSTVVVASHGEQRGTLITTTPGSSVAEVAPPRTAAVSAHPLPLHGTDAAIHVLNSTFRI